MCSRVAKVWRRRRYHCRAPFPMPPPAPTDDVAAAAAVTTITAAAAVAGTTSVLTAAERCRREVYSSICPQARGVKPVAPPSALLRGGGAA